MWNIAGKSKQGKKKCKIKYSQVTIHLNLLNFSGHFNGKHVQILHLLSRYTGSNDTETANATDRQSQAEQILRQLHEQAELRRRERDAVGKRKLNSSDADGKQPLISEYQLIIVCVMW